MGEYFHSVTLEEDKCLGCTNCIKRCPTEAIRVKNGKARIIDERCIDCGECIRICPHHAKTSTGDPLESIESFQYKVAIPAPSLLGQFDVDVEPKRILAALKTAGFDDIYEVSRGADIVSGYTRELIKNAKRLPLISSSCPVVVRLIQIRFPNLIDLIMPIEAPMEVAAMIARQKTMEKTGLPSEKIGIFFISPCPAKITGIKNPIGITKSCVDGVISIQTVFPYIQKNLKKVDEDVEFYDSGKAIGWARAGGETYSLGIENYLCVDGIENVIKILDQIENGHLPGIEFVECLACVNGCVGGSLTVENPFIARNRIRKLSEKYTSNKNLNLTKSIESFLLSEKIEPKNVHKLDSNILKAMEKLSQIDCIVKILPGLDCGACGSPSCRALAEDIVLGHSDLDDCMIIFKEKYKQGKIESSEENQNPSEQETVTQAQEDVAEEIS